MYYHESEDEFREPDMGEAMEEVREWMSSQDRMENIIKVYESFENYLVLRYRVDEKGKSKNSDLTRKSIVEIALRLMRVYYDMSLDIPEDEQDIPLLDGMTTEEKFRKEVMDRQIFEKQKDAMPPPGAKNFPPPRRTKLKRVEPDLTLQGHSNPMFYEEDEDEDENEDEEDYKNYNSEWEDEYEPF
jgi:hypothetical protein